MKIYLKSLEINALRDFDINQKIDLPDSQVVSVIGKNLDDGGSNGAGKSTFSMAPIINLFGLSLIDITSKNLKNRYLSDPVRIVGEYEIDGTIFIVDRTIGGKVLIKYGDNDWESGKTDDIQAKINNILKITPLQFQMLSNKAQGTYGGFLLMKDSEKKEFLGSFFDIKFIEDAREKSQLDLKQKELEATALKSSILSLNGSIIDQTAMLNKYEAEFEKFNNKEFNSKMLGFEQKLTSLKSYLQPLEEILYNDEKLNTYIAQSDILIDAMKKVQQASNSEEFELLNKNIKQKEEELASISSLCKEAANVPVRLVSEKSEIELIIATNKSNESKRNLLILELNKQNMLIEQQQEKLRDTSSSTCSSCGSPLNSDKILDLQKNIQIKIENLTIQADQIKKNINSIEILSEENLIELSKTKESIEKEINEFLIKNNKSALEKQSKDIQLSLHSMKQALSSMETAKKSAMKNLELCMLSVKQSIENQVNSLKSEILKITNDIENLQNQKKMVEKVLDNSKKIIEKTLSDLQNKQELLINIEKDIGILSKVLGITSKDGFIGYIFDSILEDLNYEININLKMIPNARKLSLQLNPDRIAKTTGNISKNITYQIFNDHEEIDFNSLSGGEKLSVIISVDEALDTVISRRLGVKVGWKFLDEQFSWIDENSKEALLEFYRAKASDKVYFIIDHASEFNAALDNQITIVKENNLARFNQNAINLQ